jgi:hypothetical protein
MFLFGFSNVQSLYLGLITSVLGSNMLESSLDLSLITYVLGSGCVGAPVLFVSLFAAGLLKSAGLKGRVYLHIFA